MESQKNSTKDLTPSQEDYVEVENNCCLCGTPLHFEHSHEDESLKVIEKAHCPCCKIQLKEKEHIIH